MLRSIAKTLGLNEEDETEMLTNSSSFVDVGKPKTQKAQSDSDSKSDSDSEMTPSPLPTRNQRSEYGNPAR